jgi:Holliday junction resolvase RusA-like endonuclease
MTGASYRFTVPGPPRTKKTSQVIARTTTGRPFILPSRLTSTWAQGAKTILRRQWGPQPAISGPVIVSYDVYRKADRGDLGGFEAAIDDALQAAGILENDRLIVSRAHSAKHIDRANPRVEITIWTVSNEEAA